MSKPTKPLAPGAALVDRGANGSIIGRDMRLISTQDQYIDLSGIDDHTVRNLQMVTAGAVVETQKGLLSSPLFIKVPLCPTGRPFYPPVKWRILDARYLTMPKPLLASNPYIETSEGYHIPSFYSVAAYPYTFIPPIHR